MVKKKYGEKNVEKKNRLQPNRYDTYVKILFERWKNEGRLRLSYILNLSKKNRVWSTRSDKCMDVPSSHGTFLVKDERVF